MLGCGARSLVVLNKADLAGFGAGGPIAAADRRAADCRALTGVPTVPMVGLLAAATLDDELVAGAARAGAEPADLRSIDGFLSRAAQPCPALSGDGCWTPWTCSASPTAFCRCDRVRTPTRCLRCCAGSARSTRVLRAARGAGCRGALPAGVLGARRVGSLAAGRQAERWPSSSARRPLSSRVMAAAVDVVRGGRADGGPRRRAVRTSATARCTGSATAADPSTRCTARCGADIAAGRCGCAASAVLCGGAVTDVDKVDDPVAAVDALVAGGRSRAELTWCREPRRRARHRAVAGRGDRPDRRAAGAAARPRVRRGRGLAARRCAGGGGVRRLRSRADSPNPIARCSISPRSTPTW